MAFYGTASSPHEPMHLYGFLAIFVCQPWLLFGWVLQGYGFIRLGDLTPLLVAAFASLNIVLWGSFLYLKRKPRRLPPNHALNSDAATPRRFPDSFHLLGAGKRGC